MNTESRDSAGRRLGAAASLPVMIFVLAWLAEPAASDRNAWSRLSIRQRGAVRLLIGILLTLLGAYCMPFLVDQELTRSSSLMKALAYFMLCVTIFLGAAVNAWGLACAATGERWENHPMVVRILFILITAPISFYAAILGATGFGIIDDFARYF